MKDVVYSMAAAKPLLWRGWGGLHLGSTGAVTDINADVSQTVSYAPFGEVVSEYIRGNWNDYTTDYLFNAKELDEESGMYYYSARYYSPPIFTARDPMEDKYPGVSPYAYCNNNPINFIDPTGMDVWEINGQGEVVNRIKDKTQDAFFMVAKDADGNYQRTFTTDADGNKNYNSVSFEYGTVTNAKKAGWFNNATSFSVTNETAGGELFKFFADNTKIEFGLINTKDNGSLVMTNHKEGSVEASMTAQKLSNKGQTVTSIFHNHPNNSQPSGFRTGDKSGDKFAANILPNVDRYVYQPKNNALVMYDNKSIMGTMSWNLVFSPVTVTGTRTPVIPARKFYPGKGLAPR